MLIHRIRQIQTDYGITDASMLYLIADYTDGNPSLPLTQILDSICEWEEEAISNEDSYDDYDDYDYEDPYFDSEDLIYDPSYYPEDWDDEPF